MPHSLLVLALAVTGIATFLLVYVWIGFPLLLAVLAAVHRQRPDPSSGPAWEPMVSVVIAARNEAAAIAEKLRDCLHWEYPRARLEFIVVADHCTDATEEIVGELARTEPRIHLLSNPGTAGKSIAQNAGADAAHGEVLLFTDTATRIPPPTLRTVLEGLAAPGVGLATADLHLGDVNNAVASGQGAYWRFELWLRKLESRLGILATASGQLLAVRRELFRPLPAAHGDDCILPLDVRLQGYRVVQDGRAVVYDAMPSGIDSELRGRIRMTARNWSGTLSRAAVLNPFRFPLTSWSLVSHKLLRWLTPFLLTALLLANLVAAVGGRLRWLLLAQSVFYLVAAIGWVVEKRGTRLGVLGYPFAFCLANAGFLLGMFKVMRRQQIVRY